MNKNNDGIPLDTINKLLKTEVSQSLDSIKEDENDIKELELFCKKYNIIGIGLKNQNSKCILQMLKNKMGII
jgi:hypothetical protein